MSDGNVDGMPWLNPADAVSMELGDAFRETTGLDAIDPAVATAHNPQFGDYQSNAAMALAKRTGQKPLDLAQRVVDIARRSESFSSLVEEISVAGPGFINIRLRAEALAGMLARMHGRNLGVVPDSDQHSVVIDYSSPNVAKEMHVGHLRSTIIGDALARVMERLGRTVIRQNHLGDWGTQFGRVMLGLWYEAVAMQQTRIDQLNDWMARGKSIPKETQNETTQEARARLAAERALLDEIVPWHIAAYRSDFEGETYFIPYIDSHFPDLQRLQSLYTFATTVTKFESADTSDYLIPNERHGARSLAQLPSLIATFVQNPTAPDNKNEQERIAWEKSRDVTLTACQEVYELLGVSLTPANIRPESSYQDKLSGVVDEFVRSGAAREDAGAIIVPFADRERPLLIRKSDGGYLYSTTDLAAIRHRVRELGADRIIYVVDARQRDHFRDVFDAAQKIGWDRAPDDGAPVELLHVPFGAVLGEDRKPLKTRSGENVALKELLTEAIERGTAEVTQRAESPEAPTHGLPRRDLQSIGKAVGIGAVKYADLSSDLARDYIFNMDRMIAFEGNTGPYIQYAHARICSIFGKYEDGIASVVEAALLIAEPAERALALLLLRYGSVVKSVADSLEPHRLCTYLFDLANAYSTFYQECPVLRAETREMRLSRLRLSSIVRDVIADGLSLLGIESPPRM